MTAERRARAEDGLRATVFHAAFVNRTFRDRSVAATLQVDSPEREPDVDEPRYSEGSAN